MKLKIVFLSLSLVLLDSSRGQSFDQPHASLPPAGRSLRHSIQFIEAPETSEQKEIKSRALALFTSGNYDGLENIASAYRNSKERFADGSPKLSFLYAGLEPAAGDTEQVWQQRQIQMQDWIRAKPDSPTPKIAMARILTAYAQKAVGSGRTNKPTEEDSLICRARLQAALKYLEEAGKLKDGCPVYWSTFQTVALDLHLNRKQYDDIFSQAVREFPYCEGYYGHRAIYLLPHSHGFRDEWELDLAKSANAIGGQAGDVLYARVVWYMDTCGVYTNVFKQAPKISWQRVDRGFEGILKEAPDSLAAKTERTHLAVLKGDKARARDYFLQTKGQIDVCLWDGGETFHSDFKWIFAR